MDELKQACFTVARNTKWVQRPMDVAEIQAFALTLFEIAQKHIYDPLGRDAALVARAVHYLNCTYAMPPLGEDTQWFGTALEVVLEIARPNTGLNDEAKPFLTDMMDGINQSAQD